MRYYLVYLFIVLNIALSTLVANAESKTSDDNLTQKAAIARKRIVQSVDYKLAFSFNKDTQHFKGHAVLNVALNDIKKPLSLDFSAGKIESFVINEKLVRPTLKKGSLEIPARVLSKNMTIDITYTGQFSTQGYGIQRVMDPEDHSVYIYSDSEPNYAHGFFPCFDQPDLKATYEVSISAPAEWIAISNEMVADVKANGEVKETHFKKTPLLSTYLFFVGVGPFTEFKDHEGDLPLFLYARKSLAKYVDAPRIFEVTKKGLRFFNEYFGVKYPFSKYGQIFIPEFAWGGMENPGAVTLNERGIFRGPMPTSEFESRDNLILHEMAHMWFGDYVTMQWWDDLWLNESFADYLATLSSDRAMGAKSSTLGSISSKSWGYWQDQLTTTHPIETPVPDTRTAKGNFDGITYAKGGATLKQLHFYVGEEAFREGLRSYFKKFGFKNTRRADFIESIGQAAKKDLTQWTNAWLKTSGPNRVETKWSCENGSIKSFTIEQHKNVSGVFSPHKARLVAYKSENNKFNVIKSIDVVYDGASSSVPEFLGLKCPEFIFPNGDDHDYALFSLDPASLRNVNAILAGGISDNALRLMTWQILAQMVQDKKLPVSEYLEIAMNGIENEKDEALLAILLGRHSSITDSFYKYLTSSERAVFAPRLETAVLKRLSAEKPGSDLQMTFFDFYVRIAHTAESQGRLLGFLKGEQTPQGLTLDQDRRWRVLTQLALRGVNGISELIAKEETRDPSTAGIRSAYAARVAIPTASAKKSFWSDLKKPDSIPFSSLREASNLFNTPDNDALSMPYVQPFFKKVTSMDWKSNDNLVEIYFENIFPRNLCSPQLLSQSQKTLKNARNLTPLSKRAWVEANDELSKCVGIREANRKRNNILK